jgi:mRNA interferase RelE/StbE
LTRWAVQFDDSAARELRKLGRAPAALILRYLRERIATDEDPRRFGKALGENLSGLWRYRVGDFRVVCNIEDHRLVVLVVRLAHRRDVYE